MLSFGSGKLRYYYPILGRLGTSRIQVIADLIWMQPNDSINEIKLNASILWLDVFVCVYVRERQREKGKYSGERWTRLYNTYHVFWQQGRKNHNLYREIHWKDPERFDDFTKRLAIPLPSNRAYATRHTASNHVCSRFSMSIIQNMTKARKLGSTMRAKWQTEPKHHYGGGEQP